MRCIPSVDVAHRGKDMVSAPSQSFGGVTSKAGARSGDQDCRGHLTLRRRLVCRGGRWARKHTSEPALAQCPPIAVAAASQNFMALCARSAVQSAYLVATPSTQ